MAIIEYSELSQGKTIVSLEGVTDLQTGYARLLVGSSDQLSLSTQQLLLKSSDEEVLIGLAAREDLRDEILLGLCSSNSKQVRLDLAQKNNLNDVAIQTLAAPLDEDVLYYLQCGYVLPMHIEQQIMQNESLAEAHDNVARYSANNETLIKIVKTGNTRRREMIASRHFLSVQVQLLLLGRSDELNVQRRLSESRESYDNNISLHVLKVLALSSDIQTRRNAEEALHHIAYPESIPNRAYLNY